MHEGGPGVMGMGKEEASFVYQEDISLLNVVVVICSLL